MKKLIILSILLLTVLALFGQEDTTWKHVYNPQRFDIKSKSMTVTGKIVGKVQEADGDIHIRLKLDSCSNKLLNDKNYKRQDSCLVIEIIYVYSVKQQDAVDKSKGYVNKVYVPKKGEHVRVTGPYVLDKEHGWYEIHPVSKVEVIK